MNRYASLMIAALAVLGLANTARADWGSLKYGGFQPWWNPLGIGHRHSMSPEERRLQRFWHDYYDAQRRYYKSLEHLDWVTYYKNHGQLVNGGGSPGCAGGPGNCGPNQPMIQFAPVTVNPAMGWAVPGAQGAGCGPTGCPAPGMPGMAASGYYAPQQQMGGYPAQMGGYQPQMGGYPGYTGYPGPGYGGPGYGGPAPTAPVGQPSPVGYYYGE